MLSSTSYEPDHLFDDSSSNFSTQNTFFTNTENLFHHSSTNNLNHLLNSNNSTQQPPTFSQIISSFQFVLNALPSSSSKINEDTTTYLNQGQPYEIKFHINNKIKNENHSLKSFDETLPTTYRSVIRLCFWDKTLQTQEHELMQKWSNEYQSTTLFDIDMNLTYGILSIIRSKQIPNAVEIVWDSSTTTSAFIRFKCTSTDFANKRHGGEKGIPLRIQIDTYHEHNLDQIEYIHSCCCRIQLFRLKGAQRKNKADKMKLDKLNIDQRRHYQPTCEYTILQSCSKSSLYTMNLLSLSQSSDDLFDVSNTPSNFDDNQSIKTTQQLDEIESKDQNSVIGDLSLSLSNMKSYSPQFSNMPTKLTIHSTSDDVLNWLNNNNFSSVINRFQYYSGFDLFRLTKDDLRQICHNDDAISIRLYNQLNQTLIYPLKILYIKHLNNEIYSAIYLHLLTVSELKEKLVQIIQQSNDHTNLIFELNRIKIRIDNDDVVKYSLPNEGQFLLKYSPFELTLCLLNSSN